MDSLSDEGIGVSSLMLEAGRWAVELYEASLPREELALAVYRAMERARHEDESASASNVRASESG